jgi:6-phosphofructokinase 2
MGLDDAMHKIATLTMNPALDIAAETPRVVPTEKLRCSAPRHDPGGGGINVARAVHMLGGRAVAVFPIGGPAGIRVAQLLAAEKVPCRTVAIAGLTRESFAVEETETGRQYRFVMPGPELTKAELSRCLDELAALRPKPHYIVASGSLPPGLPDDFLPRLAAEARALGARLIVDSAGAALRRVGVGEAYLLKPNLRELRDLMDADLATRREQEEAARDLVAEGRADIVVVSLGGDGAILATRAGLWRFAAAKEPVASTVGAGDSMVAGIVLALSRGEAILDAVRFGMAAGAAALARPGTELCRREDVDRLSAQIPPPTRRDKITA